MVRLKILLVSFLMLFIFSSCINYQTWDRSLTKNIWDKTYKENFQQFLVTKNGTQVVFIGKKYHYVFDDNTRLFANLLLWNINKVLLIDLENSYLEVDKNNNVLGFITVRANKKFAEEELNYLKSIGFQEVGYGDVAMKMNLHGKIYLPPPGVIFYTYLLSREYNLEIHTELNPADKALAITLTPITVAADATLWIGNNILLAPFKN